MALYKQYVTPDETKPDKQIKFIITYDKQRKSYMATIFPIEVERLENNLQIETSKPYTGFNVQLIVVNRQSKRALEQAIAITQKYMEKLTSSSFNF